MQTSNLTKSILMIAVGVLSLSTTAFAGFKAYNKTVSAKDGKMLPTATPEVVEVLSTPTVKAKGFEDDDSDKVEFEIEDKDDDNDDQNSSDKN